MSDVEDFDPGPDEPVEPVYCDCVQHACMTRVDMEGDLCGMCREACFGNA